MVEWPDFWSWSLSLRLFRVQLRSSKTTPEDQEVEGGPDGAAVIVHGRCSLRKLPYREVKRATRSFSPCRKLGKGGFGVVYHGTLRDGTEIAVKRLELRNGCSTSLQGEREFLNEISIHVRGLLPVAHSPRFVVRLLGYSVHADRARLLIYERMQNRSLQEALFEKDYPHALDWRLRHQIILDIAKALSFLHLDCAPPVIHGDIKPSNILLDAGLSARISDFGLARLKLEGVRRNSPVRGSDFSLPCSPQADMYEQGCIPSPSQICLLGSSPRRKRSDTLPQPSPTSTLTRTQEAVSYLKNWTMDRTKSKNKSSIASPLQASSSLPEEMAYQKKCINRKDSLSPVELQWETASELADDTYSCGCLTPTRNVVGSTPPLKNRGKQQWQPGSESDSSRPKDYVMQWLGNVLKPDSKDAEQSAAVAALEACGTQSKRVADRKGREWWKDEYFDELSSKTKSTVEKSKKKTKRLNGVLRCSDLWKKIGKKALIARGFSSAARSFGVKNGGVGEEQWYNGEVTFSPEWKKRNRREPSIGGGETWSGGENSVNHLSSTDHIFNYSEELSVSRSGELVSRDVSSTGSTRGTVCYAAPEYGGSGVLSEKSDIYSFGVLILVIVSGRRPIQVMASQMEFKKANLISWARNLYQSGNVLDLVDSRLEREYDPVQASLCISLALWCLQRMPARRPDSAELVRVLLGECSTPSLFDLSPSPTARLSNRSPRKPPSGRI